MENYLVKLLFRLLDFLKFHVRNITCPYKPWDKKLIPLKFEKVWLKISSTPIPYPGKFAFGDV